MTDIGTGTIIRATRASYGGKRSRNLLGFGEIGWAFVKFVNKSTDAEDESVEVKWLEPTRPELQDLCPWLNDTDHYDVVPADEVPDHIIAAAARYQLSGEANGN